MIGYQYPISRSDISELDLLEDVLLLTVSPCLNIENIIGNLGGVLFKTAVQLSLDEDVANLCEFSKRVGMEILPQKSRVERFGDNCWMVGPRDSQILKFKTGNANATDSVIVPAASRNAAMVLYFSIPLHSDARFKAGLEILTGYIESNKLWSFMETERIRNSRVGIPFRMVDYLKQTGGK